MKGNFPLTKDGMHHKATAESVEGICDSCSRTGELRSLSYFSRLHGEVDIDVCKHGCGFPDETQRPHTWSTYFTLENGTEYRCEFKKVWRNGTLTKQCPGCNMWGACEINCPAREE